MIEASLAQLLADVITRNIFEIIVKERKIRLKDLVQSLGLKNREASERLNKLKEAHLIDQKAAPLEDFTTYYVTADGLSAERKLRSEESLRAIRELVPW